MKKIHKSGKLLHSLVGNHDGIILLVDDKSNVRFRSSSQITGLAEEKYEKISVHEYCHPEDRKKFEGVITEALANPGNPIRATVRVKRKNGHYLRMEGVATNKLCDKNINGIVIDLHYVNRRKEIEQKIIKTNRLYHFISQLNQMIAWLDATCGAGSWSMTPSGTNGVVNDALAIYFLDPALARAFVSRWCIGCRIEV